VRMKHVCKTFDARRSRNNYGEIQSRRDIFHPNSRLVRLRQWRSSWRWSREKKLRKSVERATSSLSVIASLEANKITRPETSVWKQKRSIPALRVSAAIESPDYARSSTPRDGLKRPGGRVDRGRKMSECDPSEERKRGSRSRGKCEIDARRRPDIPRSSK